MFVEIGYGALVRRQTYSVVDTISSLSSGITNSIKNLLGLGLIILSYPFLLENLSLFSLGDQWWVWVLAFVFIDFAGYWSHRISHSVNLFWNDHIIHHSSENYNLACALRQPISDLLRYYPLLLIPAAIVGVPHHIIAYIAPIHLFMQFWYHTVHIGKLGWLEYIIITPSQHRVHHAINAPYIDKNLGQIFSLWDRIFGTFQEELEDEVPEYGVLKPVRTWNPIRINFLHLWQLIKDAFRAKSFWDKLRIWFMPTGWRPADVAEKYPVQLIEDVHGFERYNTHASMNFQIYAVFQMIAVLALFLLMVSGYELLSSMDLILFSLFIGISIYGYSDLLDLKFSGFLFEILRTGFGFWLLAKLDQWEGLYSLLEPVQYALISYLVITLVGTIYVTFVEVPKSKKALV
jgi:sterol desaturase/sphingolipid hydroxylase (fatty acid hydroxylase superfamily)